MLALPLVAVYASLSCKTIVCCTDEPQTQTHRIAASQADSDPEYDPEAPAVEQPPLSPDHEYAYDPSDGMDPARARLARRFEDERHLRGRVAELEHEMEHSVPRTDFIAAQTTIVDLESRIRELESTQGESESRPDLPRKRTRHCSSTHSDFGVQSADGKQRDSSHVGVAKLDRRSMVPTVPLWRLEPLLRRLPYPSQPRLRSQRSPTDFS